MNTKIYQEKYVACDSNDIEDCHRIKGDRTMIKFSSRRKSSEVLNKKKKLKNLDIGKLVLMMDQGSINESLCPYCCGLWGKCKELWQDNVIAFFHTINGILQVKKSEHDKPIIITHNEDLWQFSEQE